MPCLKCLKTFKKPLLHGYCPPCFCHEFSLQKSIDFRDLREKNSSESSFKRVNSSFFHGAYKKYFAFLDKKSYILKVQQDEYPELPVVEFISNKIAKILEIPVPNFHFIKFQNSSNTFLSHNILDYHPHAVLHHIYKYLDKNGDDFNCETLVRTIQKQTNSLQNVHNFVKLCLFDSLIGNHDRHGRNIAFIEKSGKKITLSPFYDNPSYMGIADTKILKADIQPRGKIATLKTNEPTSKDYIEEFKRLHLESAVRAFQHKVILHFSDILSIINNEKHLSKERKSAFMVLIEKRLNEFESH